eukprot:2275225-Pyramimonas_sp.AAC.1
MCTRVWRRGAGRAASALQRDVDRQPHHAIFTTPSREAGLASAAFEVKAERLRWIDDRCSDRSIFRSIAGLAIYPS